MADPWIMLPQPQEIRWNDGAYDLRGVQQMLVDRRAWERLQAVLEETRQGWESPGLSICAQRSRGCGVSSPASPSCSATLDRSQARPVGSLAGLGPRRAGDVSEPR